MSLRPESREQPASAQSGPTYSYFAIASDKNNEIPSESLNQTPQRTSSPHDLPPLRKPGARLEGYGRKDSTTPRKSDARSHGGLGLDFFKSISPALHSPVAPSTPCRQGSGVYTEDQASVIRRAHNRSGSGWSDVETPVTHTMSGWLRNAKMDKRLRPPRGSAESRSASSAQQAFTGLDICTDALSAQSSNLGHVGDDRLVNFVPILSPSSTLVEIGALALIGGAEAAMSTPLGLDKLPLTQASDLSASNKDFDNAASTKNPQKEPLSGADPAMVVPTLPFLSVHDLSEFEKLKSLPSPAEFSHETKSFSELSTPRDAPLQMDSEMPQIGSSYAFIRKLLLPNVFAPASSTGYGVDEFGESSGFLTSFSDPFAGTEAGQGRPLQSVSNIGTQNSQPRNVTGSRLQNSKPSTWAQAGILSTQNATAQSRENGSNVPENSWAQTMGSRPNTQLDLSSSSFPSLNNSGPQSQSFNPGSSAWQTGPPQSEQGRRQPLQSSRTQLSSRQQQQGSVADGFYSTDPFSRNAQIDYSTQDHPSQSNRRSSAAPSGPPGLSQRPGQMNDAASGDPSRVTSPSTMGQDSRSPISQGLNGTIGQERPIGDGIATGGDTRRSQINEYLQQSPPPSQRQREPFAPRETFDQGSEQTSESIFAALSEKDKYGMKGYLALAEGPNSTFRHLMRGQDLAALGLNMNSDAPLLSSYAGPFALPSAHPLRPLDADYSVPDCYTVKKVAPLHSRINSFSDETLFYIFYSMPRDYMQVLVGQELMERKWRYHMREQMWMMRDESSGSYVMNDDRMSEHGYYIWWDKNVWKKVRRAYTLRYEDLDDLPSVGNRRVQPGVAGMAGSAAGVNGGTGGAAAAAAGMFNAVPGLEKMAATGRGF